MAPWALEEPARISVEAMAASPPLDLDRPPVWVRPQPGLGHPTRVEYGPWGRSWFFQLGLLATQVAFSAIRLGIRRSPVAFPC